VATYRLDPLGIVEAEPVVLDDGSALHELTGELRGPGASRAGVSVRADPAPETAGLAALGPDELLIDVQPGELLERTDEPGPPLLAAGLRAARSPLARFRVTGLPEPVEALADAYAAVLVLRLEDGHTALRACMPSGLLEVLDGERGLWMVEGLPDRRLALTPSDATAVLEELAALPGHVELGPPG
jgi:hypothetical protein